MTNLHHKKIKFGGFIAFKTVLNFFTFIFLSAQVEAQTLIKPGYRSDKVHVVDVEELVKHLNKLQKDNAVVYEAKMVEIRGVVRHRFRNLYQKAQADKNFQLGKLKLSEMFKKFDQVRLFENQNIDVPIQGDLKRNTDFYLPLHGIAMVNSPVIRGSIYGRTGVVTHIFSGASGYEDNDYPFTLALYAAEDYFKNPAQSLFKDVNIDLLFPQTENDLYWKPRQAQPIPEKSVTGMQQIMIVGSGGFTGSGGGGDYSSVAVKIELIRVNLIRIKVIEPKDACFKAWSDRTTYIKDIQRIKMESTAHLSMSADPQKMPDGGYLIPEIFDHTAATSPSVANIMVKVARDFCATHYGGRK